MRREQDRLDTFHSWTLSIIMPAELAKAGFYYLGQGDRVACFSCGGQVCVLLFVLGLFCLKPFVKTVILQYKNMRQYYKDGQHHSDTKLMKFGFVFLPLCS